MTPDERDQRIADWHEGRAGTDQELHEYLGMTRAEYSDWINPLPRSAAMTPMEDDAFKRGLDKMPVSGHCDAGCGKKATTWFGLTSCATCGERACINVLQDSYDREGERPDMGPTRVPDHPDAPTTEHLLHDMWAKIAGLEEWVDNLKHDKAVLEAAVRENHEWHQNYTDLDCYEGSALEQTNLAALGLPPREVPKTLGAIPTRRFEDQLQEFQTRLATATLEEALQSAVICMGYVFELREFGLFTAQEAKLYHQHLRALFASIHPNNLPEFEVETTRREPKDDQ